MKHHYSVSSLLLSRSSSSAHTNFTAGVSRKYSMSGRSTNITTEMIFCLRSCETTRLCLVFLSVWASFSGPETARCSLTPRADIYWWWLRQLRSSSLGVSRWPLIPRDTRGNAEQPSCFVPFLGSHGSVTHPSPSGSDSQPQLTVSALFLLLSLKEQIFNISPNPDICSCSDWCF